ncbi:MAG TPA: lmo0937 family membrane protein [Gemmatimonadaceae bacterium]|nr:lmo0937 family membrane protein [Gemmatimonadaceae bacterium]
MLTIAIVLLVLWALGLLSGYALGGLIHLLLVVAVVVFALRFFTGRRIA